MPIAEALLRNPIGYNMNVMAERLNHVKDLLDLSSWKTVLDIGAMDGWEGTNSVSYTHLTLPTNREV